MLQAYIKTTCMWTHQDILQAYVKTSCMWTHQDILQAYTPGHLACEHFKTSCRPTHQDILQAYIKTSCMWPHQDILQAYTPGHPTDFECHVMHVTDQPLVPAHHTTLQAATTSLPSLKCLPQLAKHSQCRLQETTTRQSPVSALKEKWQTPDSFPGHTAASYCRDERDSRPYCYQLRQRRKGE